MRTTCGTILAAAMAIALGESALAGLPPQANSSVTNAAAVMEAKTFVGRSGDSLNYRIYAPERVEAGRRYPLVLFLHGAGERGNDNAMQLTWGVWPIISYMKSKGIDGYLIAPQCPKGKQWVDTPWGLLAHKMPESPSAAMSLVIELLEKTIKDMPIDASRVYVTGVSMGGYGTWDIVQRRPELFAAAMPVCGGGDASLAWKIRDVPIWTFHGDRDTAVPTARSRQMVSALWQCDGKVRYREYPGVGHACWIPTYNDHTVLDWLFAQKLQTPVKASRPVPRPALAARLAEGPEIIGIVHWGLNTYTDREWGFGDEDPAMLNPKKFDADQIVGACKAGGIGGLVVVAKHHDGFCLWPTKTTEHNITKTPFWRGTGNGERGTGRDYVKEMEQACRRAGIKFGVYCSPWDRNNAHYGTEKYVTDVFQQQLRELLSGYYGEIFEMWFDGANGGDGYYGGAREKRKIPDGYYRYDTETFAMVRKLQPKVCIFNEMDEADFRFGGNEMGLVDPDSRSTIGHYDGVWDHYKLVANVGATDGTTFHPIEADFPLRKGWFYHESERGTTRSAAYLTKLYLSSVGNASTMNIGIAPNKDGLLDADDVKALSGFKTLKDALFAHEVKQGESFNVVVMREDISKGEQVDEWEFVADGKAILRGKSIGLKRIRVLETPCAAKSCEVKVLKNGGAFQDVSFKLYRADPELVRLVLSSTTESGETDTAKWMTAPEVVLDAKGVVINGEVTCEVERRMFLDGEAVRYRLPDGVATVSCERTEWRLPADAHIWYQPQNSCYEAPFKSCRVGEVSAGEKMNLPITAKLADGTYRLLTEANVVDYTDSCVEYCGGGRFAIRYYADKKGFERSGVPYTPWRVTLVAKDLQTLATSDIVRRLCPDPSPEVAAKCAAFVKGGRSVWQWLPAGDPKYGEQKEWYDRTKALGFEYYLVDDGWKVWRDGDMDQWACLKKWIDYGKSIGVESFVWVDSKEMRTTEACREYLRKVKDCGAVGIKIDFVPEPSCSQMKWYEETLADTLEFSLMTDFHGCVKPSGRERLWPHEVAREAIRGHEWHITRYNRVLPPEHDCILPFNRLVQGHADYTPMVFEKKELQGYTWARELAQGIVFSAPFLCFGDYPQNYLDNPAVELIKALPTIYDETRILPGSEIGECIVVAKRKGDDWFIAVENGAEERRITIKLDFLDNAEYELVGFADAADRPDGYRIDRRIVGRDGKIELTLRPCGGYCARIVPATTTVFADKGGEQVAESVLSALAPRPALAAFCERTGDGK